MVDQQKYYSVSEVAKVMNVCVETIRRYIADGKLPALKLPGGHYRIKQNDLKLLAKK
jgi:excisionase family DNA binding protein